MTSTLFYNYKVIKTKHGHFGYSWNETGLQILQLPDVNKAATVKSLLLKSDTNIKEKLIFDTQLLDQLIINYTLGIKVSFSKIPLDLKTTDFRKKVYKVLRNLPYGQLMTYKELAIKSGNPKAARAIGMAMSKNPIPLIIPCHRVISSSKKQALGGFTAFGGVETKNNFLKLEGTFPKI